MSSTSSGRKTDYFGTFLNQASKSGPEDPLNAALKELAKGERSLKDLLPLTGNSLTAFVQLRDKLVDLGLVQVTGGDTMQLTAKGRETADLLP